MRYGAEVVLYLLLFYSHVSKQETPAARDSQSDPSFGDQESLKDLLRIVNGDDVGLGYVPFMARLLIMRSNRLYVCGGSIIKSNWVLTAAHCVVEQLQLYGGNHSFVMDGDQIMVVAGEVSVDEKEHSQEEKVVTQVYLHPSYHPWYLEADIAILYIEDGFDFETDIHDNIDSIQIGSILPDSGTAVTVTGWGKTAETTLARTLQQNTYSVPDQESCRRHYSSVGYQLTAGMWCTGDHEMTSHSAQGDSGGPVFIKDINGQFTQYGLVSWGVDLEEVGPHDYDVNTAVPHYKPWIDTTLDNFKESRVELVANSTVQTATYSKRGFGYYAFYITCQSGEHIKVVLGALVLFQDMSHVIVRDGDSHRSPLLLQRHGDLDKSIGVTSSSNKILIIMRTTFSPYIKSIMFTFEAVTTGERIISEPCGESLRLCNDGLTCYDPAYMCDDNKISDCKDSSDERNCGGEPSSADKCSFLFLLILVSCLDALTSIIKNL